MAASPHAAMPLAPRLVAATRWQGASCSFLPVALGLLLGSGHGATWWLAPVVLAAGVLVQLAVNVTNSVQDYVHGVDTAAMEGNDRTFVDGHLTVGQGRAFYRALFGAVVVLGLVMVAVTGPAVLPYGVLGVAAAWGYTAGPFPYKYHALGEASIVWLMGPLMTQGAWSAITGEWFDASAFLVGLFPGLLVAAVLTANNLVDIEDDRRAGARTLPGLLGFRRARRLYVAELGAAYVALVALVTTGLLPWPALLGLASLRMAAGCVRMAHVSDVPGDPALEPVLMRTALLHALAGTLVLVGVAIGIATGA